MTVSIEERPAAPGDAHPPARLDDGSPAALGGGRLRGASRTRPTASSRSPATCWASAWTSSSSPIYWHVKDGKVVKIEGERDAQELARVIEGVPNVDVVAEFAFGTSDKSPLGSPSEKGRIGNVHFAMGDNRNAYPGGQNSCRLHLDGVVRNATLEILEGGKGGYIFRDGQWDV